MKTYTVKKSEVPKLVAVLQALGFSETTGGGNGASWAIHRVSTGTGFKSLREFVATLQSPSWKIGCRTIVVDGEDLLIQEDDIRVSKSTLKAMLAALE